MSQQPVISARKPLGTPNRHDEITRAQLNRMVLCLGNWPRTAVLERLFQERGWKVYVAASADSARRFIRKNGPALVLLADENPNSESGWLTTWKLLREKPGCRVALIGNLPVEKGRRFARMVGAVDYLPAGETAIGLAGLLQENEIV